MVCESGHREAVHVLEEVVVHTEVVTEESHHGHGEIVSGDRSQPQKAAVGVRAAGRR